MILGSRVVINVGKIIMYFELYLSFVFKNNIIKNTSNTFGNIYSKTYMTPKTMSQHTKYFDKHCVCVTFVIQNIL